MSSPRAATAAALAAILLSGALSAFWAFFIPIFQANDEPAHFDYAISIFSAHRLISRADGTPDWIASPVTKYLLGASDFQRIAEHSPMRVPAGYGTRAYFARVDAGAPNPRIATPSGPRISYIVALYPFGFYALEALWMHVAGFFSSSTAAIFFAARLFCALLLTIGLYFNYRTANDLGIPPWTSAAIIAAIGLFPLTSVVSSYVQPDNLSFALVSAALFFGTRLNSGAPTIAKVVPVGLALGLLAVTKYQFFLCAALPILLLLGVATLREKLSAARGLGVFGAVVAPAAALLCVQHLVVDSDVAADRILPSDIDVLHTTTIVGQGAGVAIQHAASSVASAFVDCFISGPCAGGFWSVAGWSDTPIVIGSATFEVAARAVIALATLATCAIVVLFLARNAFLLARAAARRHGRAAAWVAVSDPVINSYLCFVAFIFTLYVITNNVFGLSGRHWYPYLFPAFLCYVWYAPKALLRDHLRISGILACTLLAYSLVAAPYAALAVGARYYGPAPQRYVVSGLPADRAGPRVTGVVWPLKEATYIFAVRPARFSFDRGATIDLGGFAMERGKVGASSVAVLVDDRSPVGVLTRQYLFPVAEAARSVGAGYSGFGAYISTADLTEGAHAVSVFAKQGRGRGYGEVFPTRLFFVTSAQGRFSRTFLRSLQRVRAEPASVGDAQSCIGHVTSANGTTTAVEGATVLLRGRFAHTSRGSSYAGVWLLADETPYPAELDAASQSFFAAVPTRSLRPGIHDIVFYAIGANASGTARIGRISLRIVPPGRQSAPLSIAPEQCADPLEELASS